MTSDIHRNEPLGPRPLADVDREEIVSPPRTIVVIASFGPSLVNFRGPLLEALVADGHDVWGVAPSFPTETRTELTKIGVRCRTVPLANVRLNPVADLWASMQLWRLLRELRPHAVLSYTLKPVVYGSLAARFAGAPNIYSMITGLGYAFTGDSVRQRVIRTILARQLRIALAWNDVVFFQNHDDPRLFRSMGVLKPSTEVVVVPGSGVDTARFTEVPLPDEPPAFILIARLLKEKGIFEYVEAARRLRVQNPHIRCQLLGPLDENPGGISRAQVDAWHRSGVIEYLGETSDVRPALAQATVLVLPSYREGTPRSVLEAMAMGRPVITTDAPGCRETVEDGVTGFLVPPQDSVALSEAMHRAVRSVQSLRQMGKSARRRAEQRYDAAIVTTEILGAMKLRGDRLQEPV